MLGKTTQALKLVFSIARLPLQVERSSNNLNVLRSIAVTIVFVSHIIQYFTAVQKFAVQLGYAGVLLFFVHTSLVLLMSLERQPPEQLWRRFMVRRIFRIYPLAMIAVIVYVLFNIPTISGRETLAAVQRSLAVISANLSLTQNLFSFDSIPGVLWSLPYEIQMYLFLPAAFLLVKDRKTIDLVAIWTLSVAVSLVGALLSPTGVRGLFQVFPCFMAGVISFALPKSRTIAPWIFPLLLVALIAIFQFSGSAMIFVQWALCLAVGLLIPKFRELKDGRIAQTAAFIAKHSFGIYLFHEAFLVTLLPRFGAFGVIIAVPLTVLTAYFAFKFVESPLIQAGKNLSGGKALRLSPTGES